MQAWIERLKGLATPERGAPWARRLAAVVLIVAVILLAASAADITWRLFEPAVNGDIGSTSNISLALVSTSAPQRQGSAERRTLSSVADYHLFGRPPEERQGERREIPADAPETRLNLTLKGVLTSGGKGRGAAIIATGNGEKVFIAGAKLPGNAVLERVQNDRVILSRNGNFEMLRLNREILTIAEHSTPTFSAAELNSNFVKRGDESRPLAKLPRPDDIPEHTGAESSLSANPTSDNSPRSTQQAAARLERSEIVAIRNELRNNPSKITELVQIRPVLSGGAIRGFRVSPRSDRAEAYFERAGLRPNDLILEVNGVAASNHHKMQNLFNNLENTSQVRLRIKRNGTEHNVVLGLQ